MMPWIDGTLSGFNAGLRRRDHEGIIVLCNLACQGVCSSAKTMFAVNETTRLLHSAPKSTVAMIVLPNRAADLRTPKFLAVLTSNNACVGVCWQAFALSHLVIFLKNDCVVIKKSLL